jgi:steroid delta-isomerase-like uncharacterized protein
MKIRTVIIAIFLVAITPAVQSAVAEESANIQLVEQMTAAINDRNFDRLDFLVANDLRRYSASTPGVVVESLEQFKAFLKQDLAAVPDSHQEITHIFGSGDFVAVRAIYRGTQSGPWGPFPASNRAIELPFIGMLRVNAGKVAEIWVEWDNLTALQQLGHISLGEAGETDE